MSNQIIKTPMEFMHNKILGTFETTHPSFLAYMEELVRNGVISNGVCNVSDGNFGTPTVRNGVICLNETFSCYLWCICYFSLVSYEEGVAKQYANIQQGTNHILDYTLLKKAQEVYNYGMSLCYGYTCWTDDLPKPAQHDVDIHVRQTNMLFVRAMNFIMCHELAHAELKHKSSTIANEFAADKRAIELVLQGCDGVYDVNIQVGTLLGLLSILACRAGAMPSLTHPSPIDRVIQFFDIVQPPPDSYLWSIACMHLGVWDERFNKSIQFPTHVQDHREMFYIVKDKIMNP